MPRTPRALAARPVASASPESPTTPAVRAGVRNSKSGPSALIPKVPDEKRSSPSAPTRGAKKAAAREPARAPNEPPIAIEAKSRLPWVIVKNSPSSSQKRTTTTLVTVPDQT